MADTSFMVPSMPPPACASPVIGANSTLVNGRFMALAMSWVSRVPAAPTTMPAMMSAGFPNT